MKCEFKMFLLESKIRFIKTKLVSFALCIMYLFKIIIAIGPFNEWWVKREDK